MMSTPTNTTTSSQLSNSGNSSFSFRYAQAAAFTRLFIDSGLPEFLTVQQVAALFQTHAETIRRWEKRGQIQAIRIQSGEREDRRFKKSEVLFILEEGLRK